MNSVVFLSLMLVALEGAAMLLLPDYSPGRFLFAVTVDPGFRASSPARDALRRYHRVVACVILITALVVILLGSRPEWAVPLAGFIPILAGMAAFLRERNAVRRLAPAAPDVREADLSAEDERLPWWISLAVPPFAVLLAAGVYLRAHWADIPERFPVHYGVDGPDRWAGKTPFHVYGPLLHGAAIVLLMLLLTVGTFYGSRRTSQRRVILKVMVLASYLLAYIFLRVALEPLLEFSIWSIVVPLVLYTIVVVFWLYRAFHDPAHPAEPTPDDRWYLGQLYYNPDDPAVFVQRRMGLGYTLNFGNRWTWIVLVTLVSTTVGLGAVLR